MGTALRAAVAALLLFAAPAVAATAEYRQADGNALTLLEAPCADERVLPRIRPEYRAQFKASVTLWQGRSIPGCWALGPDMNVYVIDAEGDTYAIPVGAFAVK